MPAFVELQSERFGKNLRSNNNRADERTTGIRRPLRGIEIKEDRYSVIKVITADGQELPLIDSGGRRYRADNPQATQQVVNPPDPMDGFTEVTGPPREAAGFSWDNWYDNPDTGKSAGMDAEMAKLDIQLTKEAIIGPGTPLNDFVNGVVDGVKAMGKATVAEMQKLGRTAIAGGKAGTYVYSNFILQSVVEVRQEKAQILETFGDSYIFFFGERPRILEVRGLLMNTRDFNWRTEFWYNYETLLRGTKLVEKNARIYLFWDDIIVEGYMMSASAQDDAAMPYHIPFQFQLFVTNHMYLGPIGDDDYPLSTHAQALKVDVRSPEVKQVLAELKKGEQAAQAYTSTAEFIRKLNAVAGANEDKPWLSAETKRKIRTGATFLRNAVITGLTMDTSTVLNMVGRYFSHQTLVFPSGLAGAEVASGTLKTKVVKPIAMERLKPLRGKIRDNWDEYIGGWGLTWLGVNQTTSHKAYLESIVKDAKDAEKKILADLKKMNIDLKPDDAGYIISGSNLMQACPLFAGINPTGA